MTFVLDDMNLENLAKVVAVRWGGALLEASGNVTLDAVRAVAEAGVDLIFSGCHYPWVTRSAGSKDVSLLVTL